MIGGPAPVPPDVSDAARGQVLVHSGSAVVGCGGLSERANSTGQGVSELRLRSQLTAPRSAQLIR
jgi:hypothetical protein